MPEKILESFSVKRLDILDEEGNADESLMPSLPDAEIRRMYEMLVFARTFDQRALSLQREGRIGTYAPIYGQEASQIGSALALEKQDWIFPSFRENGVYLAGGQPPNRILQYWGGDERGLMTSEDMNIFPVSIPVGSHVPHAAGAAMAAKYRGDKVVTVAYFGDGGTSEGDFHEGLNFSGVFKLPVVFICQNNQWAISMPRKKQTAAKTIAQKAIAYGIEGIQVDGNDIFAVYQAASRAVERARAGDGPTLIECKTYRWRAHTERKTQPDPREKDEIEAWKQRDPIVRLERQLRDQGHLSDTERESMERDVMGALEAAVAFAEASPFPLPEQATDDVFAA